LDASHAVKSLWAQGYYRQNENAILAPIGNARFANNYGKRRWRVVLEYGRDLFQIGSSLIGISRIQLYLKRTPRAIVKLDDGINLPAFIILVVE
jgi:hypothetical protein